MKARWMRLVPHPWMTVARAERVWVPEQSISSVRENAYPLECVLASR